MVPTDELEGFSKKRRGRRIAALIVVAIAAAGAWLASRPAPQQTDQLPEFRLERLDGSGALTRSELAGKPAVVNFWASWCGPCRAEAPAFEKAWSRYRGRVEFVGVNVCDLATEAREFVEEFELTYEIVRDPDRKLARRLGVQGCRLPVTVFVDSSGRFGTATGEPIGQVRGRTVLGPLTASELESEIEELLKPAS